MRGLGAAVCLCLLLCVSRAAPAYAGSGGSGAGAAGAAGAFSAEAFAGEELAQLEDFLREQGGAAGAFSFRELLEAILAGNREKILEVLRASAAEGLAAQPKTAGRILALGVAGAVFSALAGVFPGGQAAGAGTFLTGLLMSAVLAGAFQDGVSAAGSLLQKQEEFMDAVIPAYGMAVAWSGCRASAAAWTEFLLFLIRLVDRLYLELLLPLIRVYLLLVLAGGLVREDLLSRAAELLKGAIVWGMRSPVGVVLGFQLVQGMVLPFADSLETAGIQKLLAVIPGVGSGTEAAAKAVFGSGVVIKNAAGAAAVLVLAAVSLPPLLRLAVLAGLYQAAAAVLQPVADRRLIRILAGAAQGQKLLLGIAVYGMVVFVLAVALVCLGTNAAYLA